MIYHSNRMIPSLIPARIILQHTIFLKGSIENEDPNLNKD